MLMLRGCVGILAVLGLLCAGAVAGAGECPEEVAAAADEIRAAVRSDTTPQLVEKIAAKDKSTAGYGKLLAPHPGVLEPVAAEALAAATALVQRDAEKALAFAIWLEDVAQDVRKNAPKDLSACRALMSAHLARGRIGSALVVPVPASTWTKAVDLMLDCQRRSGKRAGAEEAWVQAFAILEEGTRGEQAAIGTLIDHASGVCSRALKAQPESEKVRRAVVASYAFQVESTFETSRKRAQKALQGYFEAFGPIAGASKARTADRRAWNQKVSLARELKLRVKVGYVGRTGLGGDRLVSYLIPDTGRWAVKKGVIRQLFPSAELFRFIMFDTYDWDTVYTMPNSRRSVGGDNVKGVAARNLASRLNECKQKKLKVKKTKKPKRTKLNKNLPAGIEYSIDFMDDDGLVTRERSFLVKAVKAEKTVQILIIEAVALTEQDPEFEAILESLSLTRTKR